jgi:GNAT superfamily N-acetyltransferase
VKLESDDGYELDDDPARVDLDRVWDFLHHEAYWSRGVPRATVAGSIAGSVSLGLYAPGGEQAGFSRAVTDAATFAWIADVFVLPGHRGRGLGKWMVGELLAHPRVEGLRLTILATADAHGLYRRFSFEPIDAERFMSRRRPVDGSRPDPPAG